MVGFGLLYALTYPTGSLLEFALVIAKELGSCPDVVLEIASLDPLRTPVNFTVNLWAVNWSPVTGHQVTWFRSSDPPVTRPSQLMNQKIVPNILRKGEFQVGGGQNRPPFSAIQAGWPL